jgi:adenylate cyclase
MRTENLSIVFIDIAGFTPRTSAQTREENGRMLQRFDGIVRPLARAYNGRVVKTIGDAYLLTFRSPTEALLCSAAVHDRIAETDRDISPADRFQVRAAVNAGDVRVEAGDVFGEAVNIAARIEGKAAPGEIYFSEAAYLSMTRSEIPSEEVGYAELKGIAEKVRIYRIPRASEPGGRMPQRQDAASVLPFAGLGLERVRDRLGTPLSVQALAPAVNGIMQKAPGIVQPVLEALRRAFDWWRMEVRRSRAVQVGTMVVIAAIIGLLVWHFKHKPATPLERLRNSLGL